MAAKPVDKTKARNVVVVRADGPDDADDATARTLTQPAVQAARVVQQLQGDNHEINALIRELERQAAAVHAGDLRRGEAMLVAQAHSLDELFGSLARRSHSNMREGYAQAADTYMRLALKAQAQCRTTWEAVAEIKNPRHVAFVRQANIAHGPQQVNNGPGEASPSRAEKSENQSNRLLEAMNGQRVDTRAAHAAGGANSNMETVGALDRTTD